MILGKNYWCADSPGLQVCKSPSLQVCKSASLQVCKSASLQSASLQVCKSAVCKSASLQSASVAHRTEYPPGKIGQCIHELLTKCEVKTAGYWPSSFFLRVCNN